MTGSLSTLSAHQLLARLRELVRRDGAVEAQLLAHLGEVDSRRLYLEEGCSSMFSYCVRVLHFAEGVAYKRIQVARAARRQPALVEAVRSGALHLTGANLLAPHLTAESCAELIRAAKHRSADEIRRLLADRSPKPDVPTSVRRLAGPAPAHAHTQETAGTPVPRLPSAGTAAAAAHPASQVPDPRPRTEALGGERYSVQFTAGPELHAQLRELQDLMRHQVPDGDLGKILGRAVALLLDQVRKRKFAERSAPESPKPAAKPGQDRPSRHIPAAIRRAVARRDDGRCTYVSASGRRCEARAFLEFHHAEAWAWTNEHSIEGITLRCRAHNQHAARKDFGERHMARFGKPDEAAPATARLDSNPVAGEGVVGPGRFELPTS